MRKFSLFLIFCLSWNYCFGQIFLIIDKPHKGKKERIYKGDFLVFKLKDEGRYRQGTINYFGDSILVVNGNTIYLEDILKVKVERRFIKNAFKVFTIVGIGYPLLDVINVGEIPPPEHVLNVGAIALTGVLILLPFRNKIYRQGNFRFRILNTNPV